MRSRVLLAVLVALAARSRAQSFNMDCNELPTSSLPAPSHGGAAGQPGAWNAVLGSGLVAGVPLTDLAGAPTGTVVRLVTTGPGLSIFSGHENSGGTTSDEQALLRDLVGFISSQLSSVTLRFEGLANGEYALYTFGLVDAVDVPGSADPMQFTSAAWPGQYEQGVSFTLHRVSVTNGTLDFAFVLSPPNAITARWTGSQLVRLDGQATSTCSGDGSGAPCACGAGLPGNGCANSVSPAGASLSASGVASVGADSLVLLANGVPDTTATLFQASLLEQSGAGVPFGDGVRCLRGSIVRIATRTVQAHAVSLPVPGAPSISQCGDLDPAGGVAFYQVFYREPTGFCTSGMVNTTNALRVAWSP